MRTPFIVTIFVDKASVAAANTVLEDLGFGPNNFGIDCTSKYCFTAPLQQWEYDRITQALTAAGIVYKKYENVNDGDVRSKITQAVLDEGLTIKVTAGGQI